MSEYILLLAPIAVAAYYSGSKSNSRVDNVPVNDSWTSKNTWIYLEDPLNAPKVLDGDHYEYSLESPAGPVQRSMQAEADPIKALAMLGDHEAARDVRVQQAWKAFTKPRSEIQFRSVNQPITTVHILKPGGIVDQNVKTGNRFWDQPVPRSTGIDRYYKRRETVPWYLVP